METVTAIRYHEVRARDLMVGDWVKLWPPMGKLTPPEIFCIHEPMDLEFAECGRCEAIRLNKDILERLGFDMKPHRGLMRYCVGDCHITLQLFPPYINIYTNDEYAGAFEILYVHELQHLLKLLKIDKEIVL